jgi:hypothetical protein
MPRLVRGIHRAAGDAKAGLFRILHIPGYRMDRESPTLDATHEAWHDEILNSFAAILFR